MIVIMITVVTRIVTMIIIKPVYKGDTLRQKINVRTVTSSSSHCQKPKVKKSSNTII